MSPLSRRLLQTLAGIIFLAAASTAGAARAADRPRDHVDKLAGTQPLVLEGDIGSPMLAGIDEFLLGEIARSVSRRPVHWNRDTSSAEAYARSVEPNRQRLRTIVGARDQRLPCEDLELVATTRRPALVGRGSGYDVYAVRWPVLEGMWGEGLLLAPTGTAPRADVVAVPDCEQLPEMLAGLVEGIAPESQFARRLAESGCRVIVPTLIDCGSEFSLRSDGARTTTLTHRELLYRSAYQMGRHLIGYEFHKVLAAVDWFSRQPGAGRRRIAVVGYGEGGLVALYAGALDTRIDVTGVCGYFDSRQNVWQEPIDRNVFGLLAEFGDAEIATLIAPRPLVIEACAAPAVVIPTTRKDCDPQKTRGEQNGYGRRSATSRASA